jgi:hypothetical protein
VYTCTFASEEVIVQLPYVVIDAHPKEEKEADKEQRAPGSSNSFKDGVN